MCFLPEKVTNKNTTGNLFTLAAEPSDGADVVSDHHERGPGEVLLGSLAGPLLDVHLSEAAGHDVSRQPEPVVVPAVNILD